MDSTTIHRDEREGETEGEREGGRENFSLKSTNATNLLVRSNFDRKKVARQNYLAKYKVPKTLQEPLISKLSS